MNYLIYALNPGGEIRAWESLYWFVDDLGTTRLQRADSRLSNCMAMEDLTCLDLVINLKTGEVFNA